MTTPVSIGAVVAADLCVGCGLCESVTEGRVKMVMTPNGSLRPDTVEFTEAEEAVLVSACPGIVASARPDPDAHTEDLVWGRYRSMGMAWAGDSAVRHQAATGGVLTALAQHLVASGRVAFVLHVGPDPDRPLHNRWVMSETGDEVLANAGSRYAPTSPLAGLGEALARAEPFALVAKPCDLGAVHRLAATDPRVDQWCRYRLAMVCGGQSRLTKTLGLIDRFGLDEDSVASVGYRGYGNPGPTTVEATDGTRHQVSYLEMWADESSWDVEPRCKLCPDALGECADLAAADAWPGGAPTGEDEGFNAIVVRTGRGERLVTEAAEAGTLVVADPITADEFSDLQPHQVRKKEALAARYEGLAAAGVQPIVTEGLRVEALGRRLDPDRWADQATGTERRFRQPAR